MQIEVILTIIVGLFIMILGYLVFAKGALWIVNFNSWSVFGEHKGLVIKMLGGLLFIAGIIVALLPFILGTENINPL
ncbi:hypothetical protein ACERII_09830 [Evansella sp. AB-rgal1]|uniref:hypothetical protein n=1 Tax=Evansella sp. AB-rgal1 TaxID=3242696 RepID=UPI00359DF427